MKKIQLELAHRLLNLSGNLKVIVFIVTTSLLPLVYGFVYVTGGIKYVYSHSMYVPIILGGIFFGKRGGLIYAIIGGILLGPLMPIDIDTGERQLFINWGYRMVIFILVGLLAGFACDYLRRQFEMIHTMYTEFPDTHLPNIEWYLEKYGDKAIDASTVAITVNFNNYEEITALLGKQIYIDTIHYVYSGIKANMNDAIIFQSDYRKLWMIVSLNTYKEHFNDLLHFFDIAVHKNKKLDMFVDVSLGVFIGETDHFLTEIDALRASEIAAITAKTKKLRYAIYEESYSKESLNLERLGSLPEALKNEELFIEYHPVVDLKTKKVIALEALIRWNHLGKIIPPLEFIPMVEETKMIDHITEWLAHKVVKDYEMITKSRDLTIFINLSQRNLYNPSLIERFIDIIKKINLDKSAIGIELTESTLMLNLQLTKSLLQSIKQHNALITIDDFGTGYSNLFALSELPLDRIKIDRDLIQTIQDSSKTNQLTKMIIEYAHSLGIKVVAEGIEDDSLESYLHDIDCDYGQGFLYTKPLSRDLIIQWLDNHEIR
ncbi:MAG: EAL domain-containing protein [Candidatus Izemoplasmataceae bacterium]